MFSSRYSALLPALAGAFLLLLTALTACGTTATTTSGTIEVVAAESFWGSIASQVGGSHVHMTSIIADPNADPHDYEPTTDDARKVADAKYVIVNGAGYDPWADKLLQTKATGERKTLHVGELNGKKEGDNPHMWYNPDYVTKVATQIRDDLKAIDPTNASAFDQSAQTFLTKGLEQYHSLINSIKAKYHGTPVGATESIFAYLAPALGLDLITPESYLNAASEGQDISAADHAKVQEQITQKQIKVLIYNKQNTPNNILALIDLARANQIPVATITETPDPANAAFQDWQSAQLQDLQKALAQATGK